MEPVKRKAQRLASETGADTATDNIRLEPGANRKLTVVAKNLKMSKSRYASAAISYFAENGLDPTANISGGLAGLNAVVEKETLRGRDHAAVIGNRLMSVIRTWEKHLYAFSQEQQRTSYNFQEQVENAVHRQLTALETQLFAPMISLLIKADVELADVRYLTLKAIMDVKKFDEGRQKLVLEEGLKVMAKKHVEKLREFMLTNSVPKHQPTPKPAMTPTPAVVSGVVSMAAEKRQGILPEG